MDLRYHDWLVIGVLNHPETRQLLSRLKRGQGIQVGKGQFNDHGLVEVPYGFTYKKENGNDVPLFYWYHEMTGTSLGKHGFENYLFIRMPEDSVSAAQYPSLEELAVQMDTALQQFREETYEPIELTARIQPLSASASSVAKA